METCAQSLNDFIRQCRDAGLKATHQRTEILRELAGNVEHPDAETVYRRVRKRVPTVSLDTVYRTLRTLEEKGIIARVGAVRDRARFDSNPEPHYHFVCSDCGTVIDIQSDILEPVAVPFEVDGVGCADRVYLEVHGQCCGCRGSDGQPAPN